MRGPVSIPGLRGSRLVSRPLGRRCCPIVCEQLWALNRGGGFSTAPHHQGHPPLRGLKLPQGWWPGQLEQDWS